MVSNEQWARQQVQVMLQRVFALTKLEYLRLASELGSK